MGTTDGARWRHRVWAGSLSGIVGLVAASCGDFAAASSSADALDGGDAAQGALPEPPEPPPPCDPDESPGEGVYVSAAFGTAGGLGTPESPLETITEGLEAAAAKGMTLVIVDEGTYPERLTFTDRHGGITVAGGWKGAESGWKRDCESGFRARTILESPESVAVTVEATVSAPTAGLDAMTITTRELDTTPPDTSGPSSIGVLVRGPASFRLRIVKVVATKGGAGGVPSVAVPVLGTTNCSGVNDCSDGAGGGGGANGGPGAPRFSADGFVPGDGARGIAGTNAANGIPGGQPPSKVCALQAKGTCNNTVTGGCDFTSDSVAGNLGHCGCGGLGGEAGRPGRGGGASIAVLVIGSGTVALENTNLTAIGGGDGSDGAAGGEGAVGGIGTPGPAKSCFTGAGPSGAMNCTCTLMNDVPVGGGPSGGSGGAGGKGGAGGGGAGGPAHAFVVVGSGKVLKDAASVFSVGAGGAGAGGAPSGASSKSAVVEPAGG